LGTKGALARNSLNLVPSPEKERIWNMPIDVEALLIRLTGMLAEQVRINADLRAEIDALTSTLKECYEDFGPRFEANLAHAKQSESYRRHVGTAEVIRKTVG
jgi:hypothetical protein